MIRCILLSVVAVASLTYAIIQHWEVTYRNNIIANLNRQVIEAQREIGSAKAALEPLRKELAEARDNIARLKAERDAAVARAKESGGAPGEETAGAAGDGKQGKGQDAQGAGAFAKMFDSEEGRKMMKSQTAMMARMMYGDLAKVLKLSPQDADQLMSLLSDRQSAMAEGQFKFMSEGKFDESVAKEMAAQSEAVKKEYDAKIKAMVGEEKFRQMQDYERTLGDRMALMQYDQQFNAAGVPLKPEQRESLLAIMAEERGKSPPPVFDQTGADPAKSFTAFRDDSALERHFAQEEEYQRRVLAAATRALSPDQVNALQQGFKQFGEMQKFGLKMMQQMLKEGNSAGPTPPSSPVPAQR